MQQRSPSAREKGFVLLAGGVLLLIMMPLCGLAVDAAFLYAIKTRLSAAADSAALAAARNLSVGMTMAEQESIAIGRAQAFFQANYTAEVWNTVNRSLNISINESNMRTRTIRVTAAVDAPLYFMRIIWPSPYTAVTAMGIASRRDTNVLMVLDRSGSMNNNGGCPAMRAAARMFVDMFANSRDRMGMVTYGVAYALSYPPTKNFKDGSPPLVDVIDTITCGGGTGSAQALFKGYEQVAAINEPGALNVIVYFTDGIPNTITGNFPVNVLDTARTADGRARPATSSNSRCYDYQNGRRWGALGVQNPQWNPNAQVYRGAVYSEENPAAGVLNVHGVEGYTTTTFTDPGNLAGAAHASAGASAAYASSGFEGDCWFQGGAVGGGGTDRRHVQYDIGFYPATDLYGTSLRSSDNFRPIVSFPGGHPYAGEIDVRDTTNLMNAAIVATDNVGKRIRNADLNANLATVVFAVGLGDLGADQHALLRRVSNDPLSSIHDPAQPEGMYLFAPTANEISSAFVKIASELLRLSN